MLDGFIKTAAISPNLKVSDTEYNSQMIISAVKKAANDGIRVLCFPELSITGYTCGDLFNSQFLVSDAKQKLLKIASETSEFPIIFTVGLPYRHLGKLYNVVAVISGGKILGLVPKTNIPNYGEFYEMRNFTPWVGENSKADITDDCLIGTNQLFICKQLPELSIGVEICEDAWVTIPPSSSLAEKGATLILSSSASDELVGKDKYRRQLASYLSSKLISGYVFANAGCGESTTDIVFGGHNIICENGTILSESKPFGDGYACSEIDVYRISTERSRITTFKNIIDSSTNKIYFSLPVDTTKLTRTVKRYPFVPNDSKVLSERCELITEIQARGLAKRLGHIGCKAVLGISGGLDSTLALLISCKAFDILERPRSDIIAVTMPGFGTTIRTKSNAELLCKNLGVTFKTISISAAVKQHFSDIDQDPELTDITYENSQARERTQILMDIANKENAIVIGTGDLSELALGWATYNGDHMSMYGVNSSIPKTLVRYLVSYFALISENEKQKNVLYDILDTPVSPELIPPDENGKIKQCTEDIVGPYDLHDFFLYYFVRFGFSPSKIYRLARYAWGNTYDDAVIKKWLRVFIKRFITQQFKRSCLPDGPKVGSVSLSPRGDWRMPSDASLSVWLSDLNNL